MINSEDLDVTILHNRAETLENDDATFICVSFVEHEQERDGMQLLTELLHYLRAKLNLDSKYYVDNNRELLIKVDGGMGFSLNEFKAAVASSEIGNKVKVNMFNLFYENGGWVRYYYTICNICGQAFDSFDDTEAYTIHKQRLGYGSLFDGDELDMHICRSCMNGLIDKCEVSPIIVNNL